MLSRIWIPEISQRVQFLIYLLSFASLIHWVSHSLADTSIYLGGGDKLIHGLNPYDGSSPLFSAPTGTKFLYFAGVILHIEQLPIMWNIVNILGVSIFFFLVLRILALEKYALVITAMLLISAPVREMVVNNQVTGFVLGVTSLSIYFAQNLGSSVRVLLLLFPIFISFELKPNLILGFLIYYLWVHRRVFGLRSSLALSAILALNLLVFRFEYLDWIKFIFTQGAENIVGFESLGLSTLAYEANILGYDSARILGVALFVISLILIFGSISTGSSVRTFALTPLVALSFPYLHLLDLIVALPFIIARVLREAHIRFLTPLVIVVIFLPRPSDSLAKYLAIILMVLLVSVSQLVETGKFQEFLLSVFVGFTVIVSNYSLPLQDLSDHEIQNFSVLRVWLIFGVLLLVNNTDDFKESVVMGRSG
jgi:hypothetical protein